MRLKLAALTGALVLGLVGVGSASAGQASPGTPGDPNCHGQTIAYLAQAFGAFDVAAALSSELRGRQSAEVDSILEGRWLLPGE